ncbi:SSL2 DNA or RNA helicases of superfamily II [uncultured Caudovirales phage]|uniref:SSL2 DNA or RNA helicases of superfamily II n=1 Tax=uncultured Caudovirales phage TaxID=2100421 RepID=A0A6J7WTC4_9CAUD|nr:SSL2 DNA or RNA helicases of superfamily II [uncultured Caudovirales phage]
MSKVLASGERDDGSRFPLPRQFQTDAHEALRRGFRHGHKNQVIMAPTGAGKTYLGLRICHEAMQKGRRAVFLCDRTTLINQTSTVADRYGLFNHGIVQANHWRRRPDELLQIASIQTIAKRQFWPAVDVLVVDECHATYKAWTEFAVNTGAAVIGLSATPFSPGLGKIFTNLVNATTMHELTQNGVLVPMRIFSCSRPDMTGAETSGGEWTDRAAEERELQIVGDVVSDWHRFGENRKTIVFGATIKHCEELAKQFVNSGVMAAVFTSETTAKEREELLKEYRKPDSHLRILISVEALAKGFDVPDVGCVADARPLRKSLSTAIQMWGRGLRSSPETGKKDCRLLDFSGNIVRFFEDFNEIYFNGLDKLDDGEKLDKTIRKKEEFEAKGCPRCGFTPFHKRCMSCGFERVTAQISEALPGHMQEIFIGDGRGKKKLADNAQHLWDQISSYVKHHSKPEKQSARAWHLFKQITGQETKWAFSSAKEVEIGKNVFNKIRQLNIQWKKKVGKGVRNG